MEEPKKNALESWYSASFTEIKSLKSKSESMFERKAVKVEQREKGDEVKCTVSGLETVLQLAGGIRSLEQKSAGLGDRIVLRNLKVKIKQLSSAAIPEPNYTDQRDDPKPEPHVDHVALASSSSSHPSVSKPEPYGDHAGSSTISTSPLSSPKPEPYGDHAGSASASSSSLSSPKPEPYGDHTGSASSSSSHLSGQGKKNFCSSWTPSSTTRDTRNHSRSKPSRSPIQWKPATTEMVPSPALSPESVASFLSSGKLCEDMCTKLRQHLCFLGWKTDYSFSSKCGTKGIRYKYTTPQGKVYYSLTEAVRSLPVVSREEIHHESLSAPANHVNGPSLLPFDMNNSPDMPLVEAEYCPQIVYAYLEYMNTRSSTITGCKSRQDLVMRARKHLRFLGWSFRFKRKRNTLEWCYVSPDRPCVCYFSLKKAMEALKKQPKQYMGGDPSTHILLLDAEVHGNIDHPGKDFGKKDHGSRRSHQKLYKRQKKNIPLQSDPSLDVGGRWSFQCSEPTKAPRSCTKQQCLNTLPAREKKRKSSDADYPLPTGKRACRKEPSRPSLHNPLTVLSRLIDHDIVPPKAMLYYRSSKDSDSFLVGSVRQDGGGIWCACCNNVFGLGEFQVHVREHYNTPEANIFLKDGRSLIDCQMQMFSSNMTSFAAEETPYKRVKKCVQTKNDHICSYCRYRGSLILCDSCPASYHLKCVGLSAVPDGDWFCPTCCCAICAGSHFFQNDEGSLESCLSCHQCKRRYHPGCLRGRQTFKFANGEQYCSNTCKKVHDGLQRILEKRIAVGSEDNLTWTLLKAMPFEDMNCVHQSFSETFVENYNKLSVALDVLHECFEPAIEIRTGRDIAEDIIFSRRSELQRLNFERFYTVVLERNEEVISVATLRIHDRKMAEIPIVGTRYKYRRLGMGRVLMNELEKRLKELGVERLVLPSVPSVVNTWTGSFGFSQMSESEILELKKYNYVKFHGTVMCLKLLNDLCPSMPTKENHNELQQAVNATDSEGKTGRSQCVDQGPASDPGSNDSDDDVLAPHEMMQIPLTDHVYRNFTEKKAQLTDLKADEDMMMVDGD